MVNKQYLIDTNRKVLKRHKKLHPDELSQIGVRNEIDDVIPMVVKTGNSGNEKKDLIEKASHLMAIISWLQPFLDGNKRTGIVSAIKFLRDSGYELEIKKEDEKEIRNLLYAIQDQRTYLDQSVVKQIIIYTTKRVIHYEPNR